MIGYHFNHDNPKILPHETNTFKQTLDRTGALA
jgi:hypothetical protein